MCWNIQETRLRTVCCRRPVFATPERGAEIDRLAHQQPTLWIVGRASSLGIDTRKHVLLDKGFGVNELDRIRGALEQPQIPVACWMHQTLDGASVALHIDQ